MVLLPEREGLFGSLPPQPEIGSEGPKFGRQVPTRPEQSPSVSLGVFLADFHEGGRLAEMFTNIIIVLTLSNENEMEEKELWFEI